MKIEDNKEYVAKLRKKEKEETKEQYHFMNEIYILNKLKNKEKRYVPFLYDSGAGFIKEEGEDIDENNLEKVLYLIIDYASKGDLFYYIQKSENGFKELHSKIIFKKIIEGIKYCHESNICHLDIKIENILLDEEYDPLITDFGLSSYITYKNGIEIPKIDRVGTPNYMCPQMIKKEHLNYIARLLKKGREKRITTSVRATNVVLVPT